MYANKTIWLATGQEPIYLNPAMANRHGLIAGATGTGKTVTMKVLAESFSAMGVPVFMADIKGDVSGMCQSGEDSERMRGCIQRCGITDWSYSSFPTRFWDVFGHSIRNGPGASFPPAGTDRSAVRCSGHRVPRGG